MQSPTGPTRLRRCAFAVCWVLLVAATATSQELPGQLPNVGAPQPGAPIGFQPPTGAGRAPVAPLPAAPVTGAPGTPTGAAPTAPPAATTAPNPLYDSVHCDDNYGLKSLFDSLHPQGEKGKHWYEKLSLRGYTQFRFGRTLNSNPDDVPVSLLGDRSINNGAESFSIRRMRLILAGDVSEHLGVYIQPDFGNTPTGSPNGTYFAQLRDVYGDVYITTDKVHRFRVGLSKVPYGFENLQSSQNRVPLDRTDPINSAVSPNERDLGVFYYWTPEDKQKLLRDLVDGGLKGSGNYGIFGIGVYNGQGGSQLEQNRNLHVVARLTYPFQLPSGQVVEASVQGFTGQYVVEGAAIRRLGTGASFTPAGTRATSDARGHRDQRIAGTFVWYPQPFGFQAEWQYGEGPGLTDDQRSVVSRRLHGGYVMGMYKHDTHGYGVYIPYARYQYFNGGYRSQANAPFGTSKQWDIGVECKPYKELEVVVEYSFLDNLSLTAIDQANRQSYRNFTGGALRVQCQINY